MIRAIIFDLWNTLVSDSVGLSGFKELLSKKMSLDEIIPLFERTVQLKRVNSYAELKNSILVVFNEKNNSKVAGELDRLYLKEINRADFFADSVRCLVELRRNGYKLGLLSNSDNLIIDVVEKKLSISKYFDEVCYSFDIGAIKPDKKAFDFVLRKLRVKPSEALMIGDSMRADIFGSSQIGLKNCLINRFGKDISRYGFKPDYQIKSLNELKSVVGDLNE